MPNEEYNQGIDTLRRDFPRVYVEPGARPIDILRPNTSPDSPHSHVLDYLKKRLDDSERAMSQFYSRWRVQEQKIQAYINLQDWEQTLKEIGDDGGVPHVVSVVLPYSFAVINTIVTFLLHAFTGRKPMFQVGSWKDETAQSSRKMEIVLQYNADHARAIKHFHQSLQDGQVYGLQVTRTDWQRDMAMRTVRKSNMLRSLFGLPVGTGSDIRREERLVYEGNSVFAHDPFLFFPDPRVPMADVNRRGEFVFFRTFEGFHMLRRMEAKGEVKWIDSVGERAASSYNTSGYESGSVRALRAGGQSHPGSGDEYAGQLKRFIQLDQGTIDIIPRELGLGESDTPERWSFIIGNKNQIIAAQPYDADHGMHPVCVAEPYTMGYGFGNLSIADYLGPLQDTMSWLVNSHMDNVRRVLNDVLVVDPSMVEMSDLDEGKPGLRVRLKKAAYGQDVRAAINQLQVVDVTSGHMDDLEVFLRIGQLLTAVSENIMGLQDTGGRKTATEVRQAGEAAASRLAAQTRIISAQWGVDLTEQMAVNIQQYLSDEFYLQLVGRSGIATPIRITPDQIAGDFYYPIHDGTLPLDRVALMDVWRELFAVVLGDPELRTNYDMPRWLEYLADLGGAKNLQGMRVGGMRAQMASPEQIDRQVQAGNMVPVGGGGGVRPPRIDQGLGSPMNRAMGALQ